VSTQFADVVKHAKFQLNQFGVTDPKVAKNSHLYWRESWGRPIAVTTVAYCFHAIYGEL